MRDSNRRLTCLVCAGLTVVLAVSGTNAARASTDANAPKILDQAMAQAAALCEPLAVLVVELGQSRADEVALSRFESSEAKQRAGKLVTYVLDLAISRNRASAARFHPIETPLLVCLSAKGVIISRDEKPLSKKLLLRRIDEAFEKGPGLDGQLVALQQRAGADPNPSAARLELADFLLAHGNALEAIPQLAAVAHCEPCGDAQRVRAWVALGRAHLWIGEPEKARVEAENLIAELGIRLPEARAGGQLVLGIHDANLNRPALARQEFEEAMRLAPETSYAKEAGEMLRDLRKGWVSK